MLVYIFKFSCCLTIFLGFYKLFLENEKPHTFKRFFLLFSVVCALCIPVVTFTTYSDYVEPSAILLSGHGAGELITTYSAALAEEGQFDYWSLSLKFIYGLGALFFGIKFTINLYRIIRRILFNPREKKEGITNVLVSDNVMPHTFLRFIFYNKHRFERGKIPKEVVCHEETHALQRHSIDVLFIELLQILMWFNPNHFAKSAIKLNHEFLADQGVLDQGITLNSYQKIVLAFSTDDMQPGLVNTFNYSFIKKRLTIMKKQSKKRDRILRSLMVLPLLSLTLYGFSNRRVEERVVQQETTVDQVPPTALSSVDEYNKLAKYYNTYPEYDFVTKAKEMWRIRHLYEALSEAEKANAEPYPKSTTSLTLVITNDGQYLLDGKTAISLSSIEALFKQLTEEELSNAFVFSREFDSGKYVKKRGKMNRSAIPPNDIYIQVNSEEFVPGKVINAHLSEVPKAFIEKGKNLVTAAALNTKLDPYVDELLTMFRKYGITVDYE